MYTKIKIMSMIQVTSREFRENQASIFALADKGTQVVISRGRKKAYILTPVNDDEYSLNLSDEALERIEQSREQYRNGETTVCSTKDDLLNFLDTL